MPGICFAWVAGFAGLGIHLKPKIKPLNGHLSGYFQLMHLGYRFYNWAILERFMLFDCFDYIKCADNRFTDSQYTDNKHTDNWHADDRCADDRFGGVL